jgi:zinc/manganese transport system permease protein
VPLNWDLLTDPLWRLPFLTGLLAAAVLPVLGTLLMLREEWLAALGLAHLAAAGVVAGAAAGLPGVVGAGLGSALGGVCKWLAGARGNIVYAFMMLAGWSALMLGAANTAAGDALQRALLDGQLLLVGWAELSAAVLLALFVGAALPRLLPRLLQARLFPRQEAANRLPGWRWHLGFDLLTAAALGVGTGSLGLMAAFALVLVPAWAAFRVARGWRATLWISGILGVGAYVAAFGLALLHDQPFAPVLTAVCLGLGGLVAAFSVRPGRPR